jgi:AAA15 family ATPase/GTPase
VIEGPEGKKSYSLPFRMKSEGTRRFVYISPIIKMAIESGKTVIIDEIDASLHPFLVDYILGIFSDREQNPNGAQLIVTTQDVSLLSLNRFRRDQIYFVEKDNRTGVTDLYSLDEFAPRKNADIRRGYLQGRYGAIPAIGDGMEW